MQDILGPKYAADLVYENLDRQKHIRAMSRGPVASVTLRGYQHVFARRIFSERISRALDESGPSKS